MTKQRLDGTAKQLRLAWMNIGVAVILFVGVISVFVGGSASTEQLVLQAFLALCGVGILARGISGVVEARRG
jgi:hypothetical protein